MNNEEYLKKDKRQFITVCVCVLLFCLLWWFKTCYKTNPKPVNNVHDSNIVSSHEINKSKATTSKRDAFIQVEKDTIVKYQIRYKTKIVEIIKLAPDTCNPYLIAMINEAYTLDSTKSVHILRQDSSIQDYKKQVKLYQSVTHNDTLWINHLERDSIPKAFKRGKRVGRKQGFVGGLILSGAVIVGAKAVLP